MMTGTMAESIPMPLVDAALRYRAAGLSIVATHEKRFVGGPEWAVYKTASATDEQLAAMFMDSRADQVAVICGAVSGNLECLDFDSGGEVFADWLAMIEAEHSGLADRLVIERSPSGGRHVLYRCHDVTIPGASKIAMRPPKEYAQKYDTLIETRGEGSYFVCSPSSGYVMIQGDICAIPAINAEERGLLLSCAIVFDERPVAAPVQRPPQQNSSGGHRPGDDFDRRGNIRDCLARHGWRHTMTRGPNEHWLRPDKERGRTSATLRNIDGVDVFYPFTTSTAFTPMRGYSPFQVYTLLENGGDFALAAAELARQGYGGTPPDDGFDPLSMVVQSSALDNDAADAPERISDPGQFPETLLHVPGFLGDFAEYINRRALKTQPVLSLGAALVALGSLTGRKIEGATGLRTNIYILCTAETGTGKNTPRELLRQALSDPSNTPVYVVDRLRTDAGIRTALEVNPCVAFVLDEIGEFLETIRHSKNSPWVKNIIPELMMLYSSAGSPNVRMGGLGDASKNIIIDCPHVCLFGTSVPKSVFNSMTMDSVGGGFLGRLLIFEAANGNPRKQKPTNKPMPESVVKVIQYWKDFIPNGNMTNNHAGSVSLPCVVDESLEATSIFNQCDETARAEIEKYGNEWSGPYNRAEENARKLALLYACSESLKTPYIGVSAAKWACELSLYLTRRLVYLGSFNIADNDAHDRINKIRQFIADAGTAGRTKGKLVNRFQSYGSRNIGEALDTLVMAEEVFFVQKKGKTKPTLIFWANNYNNHEAAIKISSPQSDTS